MAINNICLTTITMLSILIIFFSFPSMVFSISFTRLQLPNSVVGPESLAFDLLGRGPYTGVSDGRVLRYQGPIFGFVNFAISTSNRSQALCDGTTNPNLGPVCGRPLGLGFNYLRGQLYIADAYYGLLVVGPTGGVATQLATSAEGVPFALPNGLDVDQITGIVYFTDASTVYQFRNLTALIASNDTTGRLLKYEPSTNTVTVLLRNLSVATGVAVSRDSSYVLVSEYNRGRILRYWLRGPRANTFEIFTTLQGSPVNIKSTGVILETFWVAVNNNQTGPTGRRINTLGTVVQTVNLTAFYNTTLISEVQERLLALYIGSPSANFVGVYTP